MNTILTKDIDSQDFLEIELLGNHGENKSFLISKVDYPSIMDYKWYLNNNGYPYTFGKGSVNFGKRGRTLHKFLYRKQLIEKGYVIDHINRNKLDNRKENLRIITQKENSYNRTKNSNSNNKYKGVKIDKKSFGTYKATISKDNVKYEIKDIPDEDSAAKIYDLMAEDLFGEYAGKNF
jgi:hypothetical protein